MKTIKLVVLGLSLLSITSCSKTWTCEITTTTKEKVIASDTIKSVTIVKDYDFNGSKSEMKEFELSGTKETNSYNQTTNCN